jgi:hypothetical protein
MAKVMGFEALNPSCEPALRIGPRGAANSVHPQPMTVAEWQLSRVITRRDPFRLSPAKNAL